MDTKKVGIMIDQIFYEQARYDLSKHELSQVLFELKHMIEFNLAEYSRRKIEAQRGLESVDVKRMKYLKPLSDRFPGFLQTIKNVLKGKYIGTK